MRTRLISVISVAALLGVAAGCASTGTDGPEQVSVRVDTRPLADPGACTGRFRPIDLDHTTRGRTTPASQADGMGSGVTVADLDRDGDLDIVLGNLSGESSIFWNAGDLAFERTALTTGRLRQLSAVDVDGDLWPDITTTSGVGPPVLHRSLGGMPGDRPAFARQEIAGVRSVAFSTAWGDLGGDGDLDLVTGAYNAELTSQRNLSAIAGVGVGVNVYRREGERYVHEPLADTAQALVSQITDVDNDGEADVLVGNDLSTPDFMWAAADGALEAVEPFTNTTLSTMSMDQGDIDNDGEPELFATDMRPMSDDPATRGAWAPVMKDVEAAMVDDVQIPENVLQQSDGDGFSNAAPDAGIGATGWSWSGLFGDVDNDGSLDLYVVNGMEASGLFDHLPGGELIEENQAFRNVGGAFVPAPQWGLADTAGGRGMALADFDADGDLDIVVNNLGSPSRLWENQLCTGGAVSVETVWEDTGNTAGLNSRVDAVAEDGTRRTRTITGSRGYLSGGPPRAHIGLGLAPGNVTIEVTWPDGRRSEIRDVAPGTHVVVRRGVPPIA